MMKIAVLASKMSRFAAVHLSSRRPFFSGESAKFCFTDVKEFASGKGGAYLEGLLNAAAVFILYPVLDDTRPSGAVIGGMLGKHRDEERFEPLLNLLSLVH